jgi:hypothetical protein
MDRRTFLRGAGVAIGLPWLEAMGLNSTSFSKAGELAPNEIPSRAIFTCWGLGMNLRTSVPEGTGVDYKLPDSAKPLEPFRKDSTYFSGLHSVTGGHGSQHCFLTGVDGTKGTKYGISCDQVIADAMGGKTRFPTLCLAFSRETGFGGSGASTLSWTCNRTPLVPEDRPQVLFDKLFRPDTAADIAARKARLVQQGSILDTVRGQARRLEGRLGKSDQVKLSEYLASIRDIETQMAADEAWLNVPKPKVQLVDYANIKQMWRRSMFDILALALQTDSTRIATFFARNEGENYYMKEKGAPCDMHMLSHHNGDEEKIKWWTKVDAWEMEVWAAFLGKLKHAREGNSTVLDHTLALWGTTNGGRGAHGKADLPAILTGGTAIGVKHAGHIPCENQVPLGNVMRTITEKMGVKTDDRFYDGAFNGRIKQLT